MTSFTMRLAGVEVEVRALHESTREFCGDYLTGGPTSERVELSQADIDAERALSAKHDERAGLPVQDHSDAYLETLALYRKVADVMVAHDAIVFNGCVLAVDGWAYVFTAPSGTGKTTHARYWLNQVSGAHVLNGDKPLLRMRDGVAFACGTPWQGKECMGRNEDLPIAGICVLERSEQAHIESVGFVDVMDVIIAQTYRLPDVGGLARCLELVEEIGGTTPLWRMGCTLDERCARMSHEAMAHAGCGPTK